MYFDKSDEMNAQINIDNEVYILWMKYGDIIETNHLDETFDTHAIILVSLDELCMLLDLLYHVSN